MELPVDSGKNGLATFEITFYAPQPGYASYDMICVTTEEQSVVVVEVFVDTL